MWALRHAHDFLRGFHVREEGTTPYFAATGQQVRVALAKFGEPVHFLDVTAVPSGKLRPRWLRSMWCGVAEKNLGHIVCTPEGVKVVRSIKRLADEQQWVKEVITTAAGLPWAKR